MFKKLYDNDPLWQMNPAERMAIYYILDRLSIVKVYRPMRNKICVEVGSFKGGLTRVLADYFEEVISIDIDHSLINRDMANVRYLTGDSKILLPKYLETVSPNMIILDGDHSYNGLLADLQNSMRLIKDDCIILCHDSGYKECRRAIDTAIQSFVPENSSNETVMNIYTYDIDFVPSMHRLGDDLADGGLALIEMRKGVY